MNSRVTATSQTNDTSSRTGERLQLILFCICGSLLALVPLAFTTAVYRTFTLPKFVVLIIGSSAILLMLSLIASNERSFELLSAIKSKFAALVLIYLIAIAISTLLGQVPLASLFGSYQNEMGLLSFAGFFLLFIGLIVAAGRSSKKLFAIVWIMAMTGLIVATYAFAQFVGRDPFLPSSSYTFNSPDGPVLRVNGTLGHSNYLGNFLLYTTPIAAALGFASRDRSRRVALFAAGVSIGAIVFSGTRGAWLGLLAGFVTFSFFEFRGARETPASLRQGWRKGLVVAIAIVVISVLVIIASPASRNIVVRGRSFVSDRFSGAGRLLLWRDAARMVPAFALTGCGPEAFSRAFLAYKSRELAISASTINNESSHNSYLDAAISFGLPGAVLYIAIIGCAFVLLLRSRRRAANTQSRLIVTGFLSSLAAVCTHNFFIYDQIPTGMYFFALMALAAIASNVTSSVERGTNAVSDSKRHTFAGLRWLGRAMSVASFALLAVAVWFAASLAVGDAAIKRAFVSAGSNDFDGLRNNCDLAAQSADPTGTFSFMTAQAQALYAEGHPRSEEGSTGPDATSITSVARKSWAIQNGKAQALKSVAHTLTPESVYVLLAYLAWQDGNIQDLRDFASEAIRWDPNFFNSRWLMAEALLAEGDKEGAVREARLALQLRPGNSESISVLARARGDSEDLSPRIQGLVERARLLLEKNNIAKAQELLEKAIQFSTTPCPVCHRELALVYEATDRRENAIKEWQEYAREAPQRAVVEKVSEHIETLKQR